MKDEARNLFHLQGESPLKAFHNGDKVQVKILGFRDTKTHKYVDFTALSLTFTFGSIDFT